MNKISFVIGLIIAIGLMLVIPSPIGHVAKASTCSASTSSSGSISTSSTGSCSSVGAASRNGFALGISVTNQKSSCHSTSISKNSVDINSQDSNGAVSCSSHSP